MNEMPHSDSVKSRPGIVGAAIVPHAPQFLTLPETEDKAQVARVNTAMGEIGDCFRALDPDLLIVLSNAHCDDFVVRCVPFGRALVQAVERTGRRAVVLASGGLSHYPGTPLYPHPDLETDRVIFERLAAGNLRYLMSLDAAALDRSGNVECRSLQMLAGAIGDRPPQVALFEPSWHHVYAVVGWTD